jgi:CheY-like chemotaxis protein
MTAPRILLVEDHWLVALFCKSLLEDLGCCVVGPVGSPAKAEALARTETLDAAVLDVILGDERCDRVVHALKARRIPFALATGCSHFMLPDFLRDCPVLEKPYNLDAILGLLTSLGLSHGEFQDRATGNNQPGTTASASRRRSVAQAK